MKGLLSLGGIVYVQAVGHMTEQLLRIDLVWISLSQSLSLFAYQLSLKLGYAHSTHGPLEQLLFGIC